MATRKTPDKPQVDYVIPASKAGTSEGQFTFALGGRRYSLPKAQYLPLDRSLAASKFETGDFNPDDLREVFVTLFGTDELADLMLALDGTQLSGLMQAWRDASDITVGESQPSED